MPRQFVFVHCANVRNEEARAVFERVLGTLARDHNVTNARFRQSASGGGVRAPVTAVAEVDEEEPLAAA